MRSIEERTFPLEKSLVDQRNYRFFQLENGIKVMVISSLKPGEQPEPESDSEEDSSEVDDSDDAMDPPNGGSEEKEFTENKSAAALCIQAGSFSDPPEAQGLSHFLEHMVFMGSEKYPTENDFDAFLSKRGGSSNAWTGNEYTLFHFDAKRKHFAKCLDRFAQFFIAPLLLRDSTDRELAAVHSEFELYNARDSNRLEFFISSLAAKDSPYRLFGCGNIKSLKEVPEASGTDIYTLLHQHRKNMYSSHRMTLALHSKDTLDNLEALARELFSTVPNSGVPPLDFSKFTNCFETPSFNRFYRVCPLGDREKLRLVWSLPPLRNAYESAPMGVISSLVGHEGHGSILALLKDKNLAVSLSCGVDPTSDFVNSSVCTLFIIYITLTDDGRDNVKEVCRIVFDYFKVLLSSAQSGDHIQCEQIINGDGRPIHTLSSYLPEYRLTHEAAFLYNEPEEPEETVVHVANMMQLVPPEQVYSAYHVLKKVDIQLYIRLLKLFTPERASVILLSGKFAASLTSDASVKVEPWFNVRYTVEDIRPEVRKFWEQSVPDKALHLPFKNKFLTSNFELRPAAEDMKYPVDLNALPGGDYRRRYGHLWFQQSTRFKSPKAIVLIHLWSPLVMKSRENLALHMIMNYSLNQTLSVIAYEGGEANLSYTLEYTESGLKILLSGFNEKLFAFYQAILNHIVSEDSIPSSAHFESYRDAIRQLCFNEALKPNVLNSHIQFFLLRKDAYLFDDLLSAIRHLSVADMIAYKQHFFSKLRITAYVHGNMSADDAVGFFEYTTRKIGCNPLPSRKFTDVASYHPGSYRLRVLNCNPADVNMCIAQVHLLGKIDLRGAVYNKLLCYILSEPAFDYLRTKETLGYQVYLRPWRSTPGGNLHGGASLVACSQANHFTASHVAGRLSAFWYQIVPRILAGIDEETFHTAVASLITIAQLEDTNMHAEAERNWNEILVGECMFDRREASVKILKTITKRSLFEFFVKEYLEPANRKVLLVQVDAPSKPATNHVFPSKSYDLHIHHVDVTERLQHDEQVSQDEVDVQSAVTACGYDTDAGTEFMGQCSILSKNGLLSPSCLDCTCVDNLREFRSKLEYEPGRVIE